MTSKVCIPGFPFAKNQEIEVRGRCRGDGANLILRLQIETAAGVIVPSEHRFTWAAGLTLQQDRFAIGEGRLISAALVTPDSNIVTGYIFALIGIHQDVDDAHDIYMSLCSGPVAYDAPIAWPSPNLRPPTDGQGGITQDAIGTPGQGNNWTWTVPSNLRVKVLGVRSQFVTSAAVASRRFGLDITVSGVDQYKVLALADISASSTHYYHFQRMLGQTEDFLNVWHMYGFPDTVLVAGDTIESDVYNIQAYDELVANNIHYEYWFEGLT